MQMPRGFIKSIFPGFRDLIFVALFLSVLGAGRQMLGIDSDLGRHLALGSFILDQRIIPTRDLFSHTLPDQPRPPYEWLSQLIFALAYRILDLDGVILLAAIIIGITFTLIYGHAIRRSQYPLSVLILTLIAAAASSVHWLPRPHIITILFLAIWVEKLDRVSRAENTSILSFPLTMLLWANLHGGFILGMLAWAAYLAGWFWDRRRMAHTNGIGRNLISIGALSGTASIVTPDFWHNWEAVFSNRSSYILSRTAETMRPNLLDPPVLPFTLLLVLVVLAFLINRRRLAASHVFLLAGIGILSILMARNIPLFAIACTPILAQLTSGPLSRFQAWTRIEERFAGFGLPASNHMIPLVAIIVAGACFANHQSRMGRSIYQFDPRVFPVDAVNWLASNPQQGAMFNEFNWGGYLLFRLWPQHRVFLDSQSDFYGEPLMRDYEALMTASAHWGELLDHYQIRWAVIPADAPLSRALRLDPGWSAAYEDQVAIILIRK